MANKHNKDAANDAFAQLLNAHGITGWTREHQFHPIRKWKAHFYFADAALIIEIQGGIWQKGAAHSHSRPKNLINDMEKFNAMTQLGIALLQYTPEQSMKQESLTQIRNTLAIRLADGPR